MTNNRFLPPEPNFKRHEVALLESACENHKAAIAVVSFSVTPNISAVGCYDPTQPNIPRFMGFPSETEAQTQFRTIIRASTQAGAKLIYHGPRNRG